MNYLRTGSRPLSETSSKQGTSSINDGYRAKNSELGEEGIPFARAGNIRDGFHLNGVDHLATENIARAGAKISMPEDVVFYIEGAIGRTLRVRPQGHAQIRLTRPNCASGASPIARTLNPRFLFLWMHGPECARQFDALKGQTDHGGLHIAFAMQRRVRVALPPLAQQERICFCPRRTRRQDRQQPPAALGARPLDRNPARRGLRRDRGVAESELRSIPVLVGDVAPIP